MSDSELSASTAQLGTLPEGHHCWAWGSCTFCAECGADMTPSDEPQQLPASSPRKAPKKLMHVCDSGGPCEEDGSGAMVRMQCKRCSYESEWLYLGSVTEAKRGKPCPVCNALPNAMYTAKPAI